MAGPISLILGLMGLAFIIVFIVIAAILVATFITGLIGGIVLLVTGKHFSKDAKKKVASRICIIVGIIFLVLAACSAGIIINYAVQIFG